MWIPKIGILEDEYIIAKDIEEVLKNIGYEVAGIFSSGIDLLKKIKEENLNVSLVLSDINLGKESGIEIGKKLFDEGIPTVFLTAYTDEETFRNALSFPIFGFLKKPLEIFSLKSTIEIALNNFKHLMELREQIKENEKKNEKLKLEIENKEKQLKEEERLREKLLEDKNKLTKEIASFEYYASFLKSEIEKIVLEKEKLQNTKNEIFSYLNIYAKGIEFFNNLFCGILDKEDDFLKILHNVIDNFIWIFGDNCKGIKIILGEIKVESSNFIITPYLYKTDFNSKNISIEVYIYFNTEENMKIILNKSTLYLIDVFLKLLVCFYMNRRAFLDEKKRKEFFESIFNLLPFPVIYRSEEKSLLNYAAKEFFDIKADRDFIRIFITDEAELKEELIQLLQKKKKYFDYICKYKTKDGIIKEVNARRFLISENIKEYVDLILV